MKTLRSKSAPKSIVIEANTAQKNQGPDPYFSKEAVFERKTKIAELARKDASKHKPGTVEHHEYMMEHHDALSRIHPKHSPERAHHITEYNKHVKASNAAKRKVAEFQSTTIRGPKGGLYHTTPGGGKASGPATRH